MRDLVNIFTPSNIWAPAALLLGLVALAPKARAAEVEVCRPDSGLITRLNEGRGDFVIEPKAVAQDDPEQTARREALLQLLADRSVVINAREESPRALAESIDRDGAVLRRGHGATLPECVFLEVGQRARDRAFELGLAKG